MKLLEPKTNGPEMTEILTSLLKVKISNTTLIKEIEEHPNYPSLLSVSDLLTAYGVENVGIKFDFATIDSLPYPFLTQLEGSKSNILFFTVVKEIKDGSVILYDPELHKWNKLPMKEFKERCSRIALLAEAGENAGEPNYSFNKKAERKKDIFNYAKILSIPSLITIGILISGVNYGMSSLLPVLYCLITLIGTGISALLLFYELDIHNPVLEQICSSGKKINCGTVLRSKGSKIFGISWSSIGFSYFMGIMLLLLFSGITNSNVLYIISLINSLAVFYVIFSIYYQWKVAKQWCILCLCVQVILVLQFTIVIIGGWHQFSGFYTSTGELILPVLVSFTIPFLVTTILLPALEQGKQSKFNYTELQKLKHNSEIFETLLKKQKHLIDNPDGLGILLGNENATYKLIKVCNPYCSPCSKAHKPMEQLLENNPDIQIQILFTASNKEGDIKTPPVKHLLAIAEKNNQTVIKKALDDWYLAEVKDYETFASKYPMNGELSRQEDKIVAMRDWCNKAVIAYTPMFFVSLKNEQDQRTTYYQLPEIYNVADLKYFFSS
jgi:uncharacterized membrane protein